MMFVILYLVILILQTLLLTSECNDNCQHGTLRLVDGSASFNGRLEICIYSIWGTVCGFNFDTNEARVVCRQLGYEVDNEQSNFICYSYNWHCEL
jgi:deleted-in-malignant-brain-tumors protein 1